ncbi:hypothetical protein Tco_0883261 [Tanacetum coccineum]
MKNYNSSRFGKVLEAVVKIWRLYYDLKEERNLCKELDDEGTEGRFEASGSFRTSRISIDRLSIYVIDLVTNEKSKVKKWMFNGVKAFSHVNFDEYIYVALSKGLLIAGKEDLADDVDLLKLLETESISASKWEIVELRRLILLGANPIPHQ